MLVVSARAEAHRRLSPGHPIFRGWRRHRTANGMAGLNRKSRLASSDYALGRSTGQSIAVPPFGCISRGVPKRRATKSGAPFSGLLSLAFLRATSTKCPHPVGSLRWHEAAATESPRRSLGAGFDLVDANQLDGFVHAEGDHLVGRGGR